MKLLILSAVLIATSFSQATEKNVKRKPNSGHPCSEAAGLAAQGAVNGLGQDVSISSVTFIGAIKNLEIYKVKLASKPGFSSAETEKLITVRLYDLGDGCGLKSVSL